MLSPPFSHCKCNKNNQILNNCVIKICSILVVLLPIFHFFFVILHTFVVFKTPHNIGYLQQQILSAPCNTTTANLPWIEYNQIFQHCKETKKKEVVVCLFKFSCINVTMSEEDENTQIDKVNFTFPVAIEWIIDDRKIIYTYEDQEIATKSYNVPGFPKLTYFVVFETKLEEDKFFITFFSTGSFETLCESESNLCLTINNGEPKTISQKFKELDLLLHEGSIEEFNKTRKRILDPITIQIIGTITVHEISRPEDYYAFIPSSDKCYGLNEPKDFIIEVENQEIQVHKKVLQKYSPVFCAMFENGWKEAIEGRVVIPEFSFKIVRVAIELCYGEWLNYLFTTPFLISLYRFADKYDIDEINHILKKIIFLTPNNICEYANLFYAENCPIFLSHCIDRLIVYFQFSYPVKDLETLNSDIKLQFFNQASSSQAMKKEYMLGFHKNQNNEECVSAHRLP